MFHRRRGRAGVTLIEMILVVAIVGMMVGLTFPSFTSGLDGLRLRGAADTVAGALNSAVLTAERRQVPMELTIQPRLNRLVLRGAASTRDTVFAIPPGVRIRRILPALFQEEESADRYILIYPNGLPPQMLIELENAKGSTRTIKLNPITGVAEVLARPAPGENDGTKSEEDKK